MSDYMMKMLHDAARSENYKSICDAALEAADRADALQSEALDWRAQVGELSDKVKRLEAALEQADELAEQMQAQYGAHGLHEDAIMALTAYRQARDATT